MTDYSKQNVTVKFKVNNIAGDAAYTSFTGHELARDFIRSMVKRRTSRIDCVVNFTSKDGWKVRAIVTCFTLTRADQSQQHEIRRILTNDVLNYGKENELGVFVNNIINGDLAKELFKQVKELHPIRRVEVIKTKVEPSKSSA